MQHTLDHELLFNCQFGHAKTSTQELSCAGNDLCVTFISLGEQWYYVWPVYFRCVKGIRLFPTLPNPAVAGAIWRLWHGAEDYLSDCCQYVAVRGSLPLCLYCRLRVLPFDHCYSYCQPLHLQWQHHQNLCPLSPQADCKAHFMNLSNLRIIIIIIIALCKL